LPDCGGHGEVPVNGFQPLVLVPIGSLWFMTDQPAGAGTVPASKFSINAAHVGVAVGVAVAVAVGVLVGVLVGVFVGVAVGVLVGVLVFIGVAVGVFDGVGVAQLPPPKSDTSSTT